MPTQKPHSEPERAIFTIGHSTRPIEEFIGLLKGFGIEWLADIRTIPRSRHNPQFNSGALAQSLEAEGISYRHMEALGGLRHTHAGSPNTGWRNTSFRGYADYMQTPEFAEALEQLMALAQKRRVAIMCAESLPWRCHRSLVADALTVRHIPVEHIMRADHAQPHKITEFAQVDGKRITYPPPPDLFGAA